MRSLTQDIRVLERGGWDRRKGGGVEAYGGVDPEVVDKLDQKASKKVVDRYKPSTGQDNMTHLRHPSVNHTRPAPVLKTAGFPPTMAP